MLVENNGNCGTNRFDQRTNDDGTKRECANCGQQIFERYLLRAINSYWHEDCLKCSCCDCRLGEVGRTCYTRANLILCKRDYLRLFGSVGYCSACSKTIPGFEMAMKAGSNTYHLDCFACQQCNRRFCVGDRFYLRSNKILCEYDFDTLAESRTPDRCMGKHSNQRHLPTTSVF